MNCDGYSVVALDIAIKLIFLYPSLHVAVNYTLISLIVILNLTQWICCGKIIIKTLNVTKLNKI